MLRCLQSPENFIRNGGTDMTVFERLRERLLWLQQLQQQQQQQLQSYYQQQPPQQNHGIQNNSLELYQKPLFDGLDNNDFGSFMLVRTDKMGFSSPEIATNSSLEEMDNSFSRGPCSFPPVAAAATKTFDMEKAKVTPTMGRDSLKKRKAEIGVTDDYCKEKRIKEDVDETESSKDTEKTNKGSSTTTTTSKDNSKALEDVQKQDYIHVRARRGQATDNHSLAERARREKIGKKMKCLQDLVPGCNKITGKAGMLDEIINYVQSLQGQVEFLSMKLAALNPRLDFNNGNFFAKEFPAYAANFPAAAVVCSPEMANLASLQFNAMQQGAQNCVLLDMQMNPKQLPAHKTTATTTSSSVSVPEMYLEQTSSITQVQPFSAWDSDLQNLYNVEFQ